MKKLTLCALLAFSIIACKKDQTTENTTNVTVTDSTTAAPKPETTTAATGTFDINSIPVSDKDLGTFPYLSAPDTYKYNMGDGGISKKDISDFDKEYFAVNGKLIPQEGKTVKVTIEKDKSKDDSPFNSLIVDKSYDKAILALGGVKLPTVTIPQSEIDRVGVKDLYEKHYGNSLDANQLDAINTYVIRTKDKEVWIQYSLLNNGSGHITILEKGNLATLDVKKITADVIKKDLDAAGKAILNINFDTDKATLKPDGQEVVNEIASVLKANPSLKLSIEGHTDNTGTAAKNKQLSIDRATTVMNYLVAIGIPKANLKATGFGAEKPLAPNTSNENKAKNRRVELVKF